MEKILCNFLSGLITAERYPRLLCADLLHHEKSVQAFGLKPETYREWEWLEEDHGESLSVRAAPGDLDLSSLTSIPEGLDLPNSIAVITG